MSVDWLTAPQKGIVDIEKAVTHLNNFESKAD